MFIKQNKFKKKIFNMQDLRVLFLRIFFHFSLTKLKSISINKLFLLTDF